MTQFFVSASADERSEVAAFLMALADEAGHSKKAVLSVPGKGFLVPFDPSGFDGTVDASEVLFAKKADVAPVMADGPESEQRKPDVKVTEDEHGIYIQALADEVEKAPEEEHLPYREQVREWAKENGYEVGDRGAIKKAIIEAYEVAQN